MRWWRGPWGTTYPVNLRLYMQTISEKEWVAKAKYAEDAAADAFGHSTR